MDRNWDCRSTSPIGHPIELDRVLGMEANFAGTSFLTLEKLGNLRYGSELVNVVADARQEHGPGLGTFAYDDEGVAAQSHADHHERTIHRISQFARDGAHDWRRRVRAERCAPRAGTGCP